MKVYFSIYVFPHSTFQVCVCSIYFLLISLSSMDQIAERQLVQEARFYGLPELERQLTRGLWTVGTKIDVLDTVQKWCVATIKEVTETSFFVSFEGWSKKWNSWLSKDSHRLGTRTLLPKKKSIFFF